MPVRVPVAALVWLASIGIGSGWWQGGDRDGGGYKPNDKTQSGSGWPYWGA